MSVLSVNAPFSARLGRPLSPIQSNVGPCCQCALITAVECTHEDACLGLEVCSPFSFLPGKLPLLERFGVGTCPGRPVSLIPIADFCSGVYIVIQLADYCSGIGDRSRVRRLHAFNCTCIILFAAVCCVLAQLKITNACLNYGEAIVPRCCEDFKEQNEDRKAVIESRAAAAASQAGLGRCCRAGQSPPEDAAQAHTAIV
eukprot:scaffold271419_cov19-Tisochrysis_lutea.AAC.1